LIFLPVLIQRYRASESPTRDVVAFRMFGKENDILPQYAVADAEYAASLICPEATGTRY
jgi:hypothetical protein